MKTFLCSAAFGSVALVAVKCFAGGCLGYPAVYGAMWLSVPSAPVAGDVERKAKRAADGTSWFASTVTNAGEVVSATWTVAGLGVFEAYVNGHRVGDDFLKPGFTSADKTKYSFSYDVTKFLKTAKGEANVLAASVSSGWWRDQIAGFAGKKSAFHGELKVSFADGTSRTYGTDPESWTCGIAGRVTHAGIFDGEEYDARKSDPVLGEGLSEKPEVNDEFRGELLPSAGAEICLREDLKIVRGPFAVCPSEPLVVDFGQNCAAVPRFHFKAKRGTILTVLPGEMLNDADKGVRGSDGPKGSVYRANLRIPATGMRLVYTFSGEGAEEYLPRFTFFGYRYLSITATDEVEIERIETVPVTSVAKSMELGRLETGDASLNQFISNVYWGQLSNYLSVPTDCPQRDERLGWSADTQVFAEAGSFNADTTAFFRKWMRDMRDSVSKTGSFSGMAPTAQYGARYMRIGWSDAGVIVPYTVWRQFGDTQIVRENWAAMAKYVDHVAATRYDHWALAKEAGWQYADWLSFENLESRSQRGLYQKNADGNTVLTPEVIAYWNYLGACYWRYDALLMVQMARGIGDADAAAKYTAMAEESLCYLRKNFIDPSDGRLLPIFRSMQTPAVFALKFGIFDNVQAVETTKEELRRNIAEHGGCLTTGFLGTSFIMDALSENGMSDVAYGLLLNHNFPSWLYSVDQGATTVWERWNSYTKKDGFGPVDMNSFNHYAYGAVLAWMYRTMAGIAAAGEDPGFRTIVMAPKPDRRVGYVKAEYRSAAGLVKSAWRYEGKKWIWDFEVPEGAKAKVSLPGETSSRVYGAGKHHVEVDEKDSRFHAVALGASPVENRAAIQREIDTAFAAGGGRVVIPAGEWPCGSIQLKSGVELHLEKGATLIGSVNRRDYNANDAFPDNVWSEAEEWSGGHLVWAWCAEKVAITGEGTIDGNGPAFFGECDEDSRWPHYKYGLKLHPLDREWFRPGMMVAFFRCKDIRIEGVKLVRTPAWTCHFRCCDGVKVRGVTIDADRTIANSDGFSIDCTRNVTVEKCVLKTGDDGFAIRASCRHHASTNLCENIEIRDCDVWSCCYGIRFGIGSGTIRNVRVLDTRINEAASAGIGFTPAWVASKRNCYIENILLSNCTVAQCVSPVSGGPSSGDSRVADIRFEGCTFRTLLPMSLSGGDRCQMSFRNCVREPIPQLNVRHRWKWNEGAIRNKRTVFAEVGGDKSKIGIENCRPLPFGSTGVLLLSFDDRNFEDWVRAAPLFEKYGAHATFFVSGEFTPDAVRAAKKLMASGHSIGLHGQHHGHVNEIVEKEGWNAYCARELDKVKRQCDVAYIPVRNFAYPDGCRNESTDKHLLTRFDRIRGPIAKGVRPYDPKGEKRAGLKPLVTDERVFFPVSELPKRRVLDRVLLGEAYNTDIDDVVACIRRAGERKEVLVLASHGIHPDARKIHMKTEWLETILATAKECGVSVLGFEEVPLK